MRILPSNERDQPCCVCGSKRASTEHEGSRYCVKNGCGVVAASKGETKITIIEWSDLFD